MLPKIYNESGQKARQTSDTSDRTLPYRDWMRTVDIKGLVSDCDMYIWKGTKGNLRPAAILELTKANEEKIIDQHYLNAITERYFVRDDQGEMDEILSKLLNVPVFIILFKRAVDHFWIFSFRRKEWREFTPDEWVTFLNQL